MDQVGLLFRGSGKNCFWGHSGCWYNSVPHDCWTEVHVLWLDVIWELHLVPRSCSSVFTCSSLSLLAGSGIRNPSHMSNLSDFPFCHHQEKALKILRAHPAHLGNWSILRSTVTYKINVIMGVIAHYIQILGTRAGYLWGNILEILLTGYRILQV